MDRTRKRIHTADVAVIGGGILGLAFAYTAARDGQRVVLFERSENPHGASLRNLGLIWPLGQNLGLDYELALRSREIWIELAERAGFWYHTCGALIVAYRPEEQAVLDEFFEREGRERRGSRLLTPGQVAVWSPSVLTHGLRCGLWSPHEMSIDPRQVLRSLPDYLSAAYPVELRYRSPVLKIEMPYLETPSERWRVERVFVCTGAEFDSLYPHAFQGSRLTKCKLLIMRTIAQPDGWRLGPALGSGLSMLHYKPFERCESSRELRKRVVESMPLALKHGIQVLISQNGHGELTIGGSHEYGLEFSPFESDKIYQYILGYLGTFARVPQLEVASRWHGIFAMHPERSFCLGRPEEGVTIVNGVGENGATIAFGLAEHVYHGKLEAARDA